MKNSSQFVKGVFNEYMNFGSNGRNGCTLIVKKKKMNNQSSKHLLIDFILIEESMSFDMTMVQTQLTGTCGDSFHTVLSEKRMIFSG